MSPDGAKNLFDIFLFTKDLSLRGPFCVRIKDAPLLTFIVD